MGSFCIPTFFIISYCKCLLAVTLIWAQVHQWVHTVEFDLTLLHPTPCKPDYHNKESELSSKNSLCSQTYSMGMHSGATAHWQKGGWQGLWKMLVNIICPEHWPILQVPLCLKTTHPNYCFHCTCTSSTGDQYSLLCVISLQWITSSYCPLSWKQTKKFTGEDF